MFWRIARNSPAHIRYSFISKPHQHTASRGYGVRMSPIAKAKSLDHLVLTVKDLDATVKFYGEILGMQHTSFGAANDPSIQRHALKFGSQKINLHISGKEFVPRAQNVQPGSGDLCFLVEDNVDDVLGKLNERKIDVLEGGKVVHRTGAQGQLRSVYIRDPDENLIE
ncbi:hypothetical protein H2204_002632 [Knufia peltigerae]|uniref:VOC domain-containing protein n=1 Tax=Knufia peltigerae TaxID=1002370 RepID=A0AA39D183_9EURO|nr:hypothetical protein H2204_002632 [Knufia peltigerae]